MTEGYQPSSSEAETQYLPSVSSDVGGSTDQSTSEVAKDQASDLKDGTVQAGQQVASTAKEQTGQVVSEAGRQAKDLLGQARSEVGQQASAQQERLTSGLRSLSGEMRSMAQNSDQQGIASELAHQGADVADRLVSWMDGREPTALVEDVRSFARRRPGTFLLLAAGAGLMAGRLTRGLKDQASDSGSGSGPGSAPMGAAGEHGAPLPASTLGSGVPGSGVPGSGVPATPPMGAPTAPPTGLPPAPGALPTEPAYGYQR